MVCSAKSVSFPEGPNVKSKTSALHRTFFVSVTPLAVRNCGPIMSAPCALQSCGFLLFPSVWHTRPFFHCFFFKLNDTHHRTLNDPSIGSGGVWGGQPILVGGVQWPKRTHPPKTHQPNSPPKIGGLRLGDPCGTPGGGGAVAQSHPPPFSTTYPSVQSHRGLLNLRPHPDGWKRRLLKQWVGGLGNSVTPHPSRRRGGSDSPTIAFCFPGR